MSALRAAVGSIVFSVFLGGAAGAEATPSTAPKSRARARPAQPSRPSPARPADDDDDDDDDFDTTGAKRVKAKEVKTSAWHPDSWSDPRSTPKLERAVTFRRARTTSRHTLLLTVDHRTAGPAFHKNSFRDFFGFDVGSLKIGLGLRFGILESLDVGVYRINGTAEIFDTYEIDLRWQFLRQDRHQLNMAVVAGLSWFYQTGFDDENGNGTRDAGEQEYRPAYGGYGQLILGRTLWRRLTVGVAALFHSESSSDIKTDLDPNWSFAVGGFLEVRIGRWLAWNIEVVSSVAGYGVACLATSAPRRCWPTVTSSVKFLSQQHTFALILSNTSYYSNDGIVANTSKSLKDLIVGFSITREFRFAK